VQDGVAGLLGVDDAPELAGTGEFAGVADLAAHLGVADGVVEDDDGLVLELDDFLDVGAGVVVVVAEEVGGCLGLDLGKLDDLLLLGGAGAGALLFHQLLEAFLVHRQAAFAGHQFGEIEREAVGIIENKSSRTIEACKFIAQQLSIVLKFVYKWGQVAD
jgi:hypothetical protein